MILLRHQYRVEKSLRKHILRSVSLDTEFNCIELNVTIFSFLSHFSHDKSNFRAIKMADEKCCCFELRTVSSIILWLSLMFSVLSICFGNFISIISLVVAILEIYAILEVFDFPLYLQDCRSTFIKWSRNISTN